eukprot:1277332-Pyramimonas_sp.AAC.2
MPLTGDPRKGAARIYLSPKLELPSDATKGPQVAPFLAPFWCVPTAKDSGNANMTHSRIRVDIAMTAPDRKGQRTVRQVFVPVLVNTSALAVGDRLMCLSRADELSDLTAGGCNQTSPPAKRPPADCGTPRPVKAPRGGAPATKAKSAEAAAPKAPKGRGKGRGRQ